MNRAELKKAAVPTDDGSVRLFDIVTHEGEPWLVTAWIRPQADKPEIPRRLLRLGSVPHRQGGDADVTVETVLGMELLRAGPAPEGSGIDLRDGQFKLGKDGALRLVGFAPPMAAPVA